MAILTACSSSGGASSQSAVPTEAAAATAAASTAASASPSAAETMAATGEPVTIRYWDQALGGADVEAVQKIVDDFNAANPDVKVEYRPVTVEYRTVIRPAFTAGDPPEIFSQEGFNDLWGYIKEGQVTDISDWWSVPGNGDRFLAATVPSVEYEGKQYGIPMSSFTTNQIFYNKTILKDNGIDPATLTTWDAFLAAFATLKAAGIQPLAYGDKDGWPGSEWFYNFMAKDLGAERIWQTAAGNCGFKWNDPDVVAAAQKYIDLKDLGYFPKDAAGATWDQANAVFLSGKAGFYYMGNWFVGMLKDANKDGHLGMLTFPVTGGKGTLGDVLVSTQGLALSSSASDPAKKAGALRFLDYYTQVAQQQVSVKLGNISSIAAANDPALMDPLNAQIFKEQVESSTRSYPFVEHIVPLKVGEDAIWKGGIAAVSGQMTAQQWMDSVQKAADGEKPLFKLEAKCT